MAAKPKTTMDAPPRRGADERPGPVMRRLFGPEGIVSDRPTPLRAGHYAVGREVSDGFRLDDPRVSRLHATLHVASRSHKVRIADEDSRHGTWVNGRQVEEAWLADGDMIRVGDTFLFLRFERSQRADADIDDIIGHSPAMCALRHSVQQVAAHDVTVMLRGASGTGKEVVARAIHRASARHGAFIAVNCAAIPENLAESQLFGHVAGSFTGARGDHDGFFRAAQNGTVFLDEIGDMPSELQPKLLRALEQRTVTPVGSTAPVAFDARIVVATHRDLEKAIDEGTFRGDLYARLAYFQIDLPTLGDRREDILVLMRHALGGEAALAPDLVDLLLRYHWPYNVRELFAVAGELRVRGAGAEVMDADLVAHRLKVPLESGGQPAEDAPADVAARPSSDGGDVTGDKAAPPTRAELERLVEEHRGNVRAIARATGRSRMQVYRWVEQYELDLARYRT